jgi:hypothetical protein
MKKTSPITFSPAKFVTPVGTAKWCHLEKPRSDERFGTTNYEATIILDGQAAETKALVKSLQKAATDLAKGIGKTITEIPWIKTTERGEVQITFKRAVRDGNLKPIPVLDTAKQVCKEPWGGDKIRVAFSLGLWKTAMGFGVKAYPNGVQVVERGTGVTANAADAFPDDLPVVDSSSTDIPF